MEGLPEKRVIEIEAKGTYFDVDEDGYILNPASLEKIQDEWKPLVDDIVNLYKKTYGDHLKQVYIRGSVAKGDAIRGVSDIDSFAYVDLLEETRIEDELIDQLEEKYDFVDEVEMDASPIPSIEDSGIILNQSVCVYGDPLPVRKMRVGKEMAIQSLNSVKRFERFEYLIGEDRSEEEVMKGCVWIMKEILRVGFEITMERSRRYTRDLYPCYETFSEYYPEKQEEMREVLYYALNPTTNREKIRKVIGGIGEWLLEEVPNHFKVNK